MLATLVHGAKDLVQKLVSMTKTKLENYDYLNARLCAELGSHPQDWGTESTFKKLAHVVTDVDELYQKLSSLANEQQLGSQKVTAECCVDIQVAVEQVQQDMLHELQPIFELFALQSTSKATPGDKYQRSELKFLQYELAALKRNQVVGAAPVAGLMPAQGVTWGLGSLNLTMLPQPLPPQKSPSRGVTPMMPQLTGKFQSLEESIQNTEAQLVSERVELGGVVFSSRSATKAWLKVEVRADMAYMFFLDPHSFLNVGDSGANDSTQQLTLQAAAAKAGFTSAEEALVISSYKFELPTFFGKASKDS
jgi:hypothetical protein